MRKALLAVVVVAGGCASEPPRPPDLRAREVTDDRPREVRAVPSAPRGAPDRAGPLGLAAVIAAADQSNPTLAAERKEIDVATAAIWEAKLYPNPSALIEFDDYRSGGRGDSRVGVRVPLVVGGRIRAATSLAGTERDVAALKYLARRREILLDVRKAYVELLAAQRNRDLARENRDLAREVHSGAESRLKADAVPEMEVLKASVDLAKAEAEVDASERALAAAERALDAAVGPGAIDPSLVTGSLSEAFVIPPLDDLRATATESHPTVAAAEREKDAAAGQLRLAQAERTPDVDLEVKAGQDTDGQGTVSLGLGIPLPFNNRNEGKVATASARIAQGAARVAAARAEIDAKLARAYRSLTTAQDRGARYASQILPAAQKALEQTRVGYEKGKFTYLDVLDARRTLADAKSVHAAAVLELNAAAAEIESLGGIELRPTQPGSK
jgi:outer membrane protein, heavy metal efflux system